jgi:hypothetical protein
MCKLDSLELTTEMSMISTDNTYALYIGQTFFEERIGLTYDMILHIHVHE